MKAECHRVSWLVSSPGQLLCLVQHSVSGTPLALDPRWVPGPWRVLLESCWLNRWLSNQWLEAAYKQLWLTKMIQVVEVCGR